ncbi:MAG: helix-turn-helix domain-containing protein, partial [Burkholderiales bacterium]|nr:helix-turn-helix domain-containing protein [Anaerolineae bacterium]
MSETLFFGKWIAQRRKTLDMTQRELAAQTNCTLATIKKIEQDERRPSRELAEGMASALRIPADKIAMFVECARGLRSVDVLVSIGVGWGAEKNEARTAIIPVVLLPSQSTPFIGREAELSQIAAYLDDATCRLLTLVGPGGIGKTRLAYQAAAASTNGFRSGVYAVPLAGVSTADALLPAIAERLKFTFQSGDPKAQLLHFLHQKRLLLILDNLEHLLDGVGLLSEILQVAPGVKILATSRERLNLSAEWLFPVDGLLFPTDADQKDQAGFSAVQLFEGCARRALPSFHLADQLSATIHVCQLLEGMPLAIELAASWARQMSCEQIAEQIQRDLNFLSAGRRDVPERHRSIGALFDHSWRLLSIEEQAVLMKLSVFRGGFELEAAQAVAGARLMLLSALEDKSLVQGSPSGRYNLHELIRQYAESRLNEAGKSAETQHRHLDYYINWVETAENQLHTGEQINTARRIKIEYNNLRAALARAFDGGDPEKGLRVTNALWFYWFRWSGNWVEGFKWTELGLNQTEGITPARADAYGYAGTFAAQTGNLRTAIDYMQRGFELSQALGLAHGIARYAMGISFRIQDYAQVAAKFEEAIVLLRESGPRFMLSTALFLYGDRARVQGDLDRAQSLYEESLIIARAEQDFQMMTAPLAKLGRLAALKGDYQQAHHFYAEGMELARQLDVTIVIAEYSLFLGAMAVYQGDHESAKRHLNEALAVREELADSGGIIQVTYFLAELELHLAEFNDTIRLLVESITMTLRDTEWQQNFTNHEFNTERLIIAGKLAWALGDYAQAGWLLGAGEAIRMQSNYLLDALARGEYENAVHEVRTALGNEAFD